MLVCVLQLLRPWTWATSRNATHRTRKSPSPSCDPHVTFSTRYPQTFPPAAKSAPLVLLASIINLCSKLRTRETPETSICLSNLCNCRRRKRSSIPGSANSLVTWFTWTGLMQNFAQKFADVQPVITFQGTQLTAVLIQTQFCFTSAT